MSRSTMVKDIMAPDNPVQAFSYLSGDYVEAEAEDLPYLIGDTLVVAGVRYWVTKTGLYETAEVERI